MTINPRALYSDLLNDLTDHLMRIDSSPKDTPFTLGLRRWAKEAALMFKSDNLVGLSVDEVACRSLAQSFLKKFVEMKAPDADVRALSKFLHANEACAKWSAQRDLFSWQEELVGSLKMELSKFFDHDSFFEYKDVFDNGDLGPGVNLGSRGTDFYTKMFDGPLTCTSAHLYSLYSAYSRTTQRHRFAENRRTKRYGAYSLVRGNRLSYVPKNNEISRTICAEPVLNMFCQLGFGRLIEQRLRHRSGIDLADQQAWNRRLAFIGSLPMGPMYATLDLESASDRTSVGLVRELLPAHIVDCHLLKYRSPEVELPSGLYVELGMLSSMGNGYTFPLMTALFYCAVASVYRSLGIVPRCRGSDANCGVFGDDIVVVPESVRRLKWLLGWMGHVVNEAKSFSEGPFRESCGGDYYIGRPVRGVYAKSLNTKQDLFALANRLNAWSADTGISLPTVVPRILKETGWLPVPRWENEDCGYRVPSSMVTGLRLDPECQSVVYKRYQAVPSQLKIGFSRISVPRKAKERSFNNDGLICAFLKGTIRSHVLPTRSSRTAYRLREGIAPNWDLCPEMCVPNGLLDLSREVGLRRWDNAVLKNSGEFVRNPR